MVSRSILALFAVALIAAVVSAAPVEEVDDFDFDEEFERGWKDWITKAAKAAAKKLIELAEKEIGKINFECVEEVVSNCHINPIKHPKDYFNCAKNYFVEHKDHCFKN